MSLDVESLAIPDVRILRVKKFEDARGFFSETYNANAFLNAGITVGFVQDNQSLSMLTGTLRGLHGQRDPFAQDKLVRVAHGRIFDVAVDARSGSPSFGRWAAAEISADSWNQIFIPAGFLHGFCTLEPNTEVHYKVSKFYSAAHEFGVRWNDPDLKITWPIEDDRIILSEKDRALPLFKNALSTR
jgi:dTDP-4-dehydrorhamnose 3,5-epimerase